MVFSVLDLLCFFLFMTLPYSTIAQTSRNISSGSSPLTARNDDNSSWPSPSGEFAFGFRQIGKDGFLLAIWFNNIPERAIVWSANGNNLVPQGSQVELTSDGQFILKDATGNRIWYVESTDTEVAYAAMLDTGNFVLANRNSSTFWQSFDHPTDTILPTQTLNQNSGLYASYTATNYSRGRFLFLLQSDGNLVLSTTNFPQDSANFAYWSAGTTNIGFQVIFNQSGPIYVVSRNGSVLKSILQTSVSTQNYYQRVTLEYDGVLRHYFYPKSASSIAEPRAWSTAVSIPENICFSVAGEMGGGACGFNSLCSRGEDGPNCDCPRGYTSIDPNDVRKGCKQNFVPQSCDQVSPEHLFDFEVMQNTDFVYGDYEYFKNESEDWCRQNCLDDCFCAVAIVNPAGDCFKKRLPFSNGRLDPSVKSKALIKFGKDNSTWSGGGAITKKKDISTLILVGLDQCS